MQQKRKKIKDLSIFWSAFLLLEGENKIKRIRGVKVKVIFQGLHITHVIFVLVYNLKICILGTPFNIAF
jgi:hypothetical protein